MQCIPLCDVRASYSELEQEINSAIADVMNSGRYILGEQVAMFELEFAAFVGAKHAVSCNSGTDALILALRAMGVGLWDEVITVPNTAIPTVAAIRAVGATPVLADVDPVTYTMNPDLLPAAISDRTKAIIPVHLYGQPANMLEIMKIAYRFDVPVIEDCAQAAGAMIAGRQVGAYGVMGCFSFYPTKNLGCFGDGGMIVCNDCDIAEKVKRLRYYGQSGRYTCVEEGINSRLDELQAAILRVKLRRLSEWNQKRQQLAKVYDAELNGLVLPKVQVQATHVYHLYVVQHEQRDKLKKKLNEHGISAEVHYPVPIHFQPAWKDLFAGQKFPVSESLCNRVLSLPIYPQMSVNTVHAVCREVA